MAEAPAEVNEINEISAETGMTSAMPVSLCYESNPVTQAISKRRFLWACPAWHCAFIPAFPPVLPRPAPRIYSGIPSGAATSGAAPSPGIPSGGTSPGIPPSWGMPSTTGSVPGK